MPEDALVLVFARNAFYKRLHYLVLAAFGLSLFVILSLILTLIYVIKHPPKPVYFATDHVGRLIKLVPVTEPNMSNDQVIAWVIEAVQSAYSYDYVNYHAELQSAQKYFTNFGWTTYMSALTASNNILALTQRKMIIQAKVVEQPKILIEGILSGAYAWKLQMPMLVTYWAPPFDDNSKFSNPLTVTVIVQRQPELQSYHGLGVVQMIASLSETVNQPPQEISGTPE